MFFITTLRIEENEIKDERCVGYFSKLEEVEYILKNNSGDIFEFYYNFAVVEKISEGLYQYDRFPIWYNWDKNKQSYIKCECPTKELEKTCGFSIG